MWARLLGGLVLASAALGSGSTGCGDDSSSATSGTAGGSSTGASTSPGSGGGGPGSGGASSTSGNGGSGDGGASPTSSGSGGSSQGGSAPVVCDGGPTFGKDAECVACQSEKCCINAAGCLGDEDCLAVEACTLENNTLSECTDANHDAIWLVSGVVVCRQNNCADECDFAQAECGNILPSPASCTDEVQAACCDETAACGANDACVALIYQCFDQNDCSSASCFEDCIAQYPDGEDDFNAMADCWDTVECL